MENCLVTKLKSVVNNDNLPIFGKFRVYHYQSESYSLSQQFIVRSVRAEEATVTGGTFVDSNGNNLGTTIQLPANTNRGIRTSNNDCVVLLPLDCMDNIKIFDGYYIRSENMGALWAETEGPFYLEIQTQSYFDNVVASSRVLNFTDLYIKKPYSGDLTNLHAGNIDVDASKLYGSIHPYNVQGNIALLLSNGTPAISIDFNEYAALTISNIRIRNISGGGDIGVLNFANDIYYIDLPNGATGSVESVVEKLWRSGKRSGTITFCCYNSAAPTLNGSVMRTTTQDWKLEFSDNAAVIKTYFSDIVKATYNGSSWTYTE